MSRKSIDAIKLHSSSLHSGRSPQLPASPWGAKRWDHRAPQLSWLLPRGLASKSPRSESQWEWAFVSPQDHVEQIGGSAQKRRHLPWPSPWAQHRGSRLKHKVTSFSLEGVYLRTFLAAAQGLRFWPACIWKLLVFLREPERACGHFHPLHSPHSLQW